MHLSIAQAKEQLILGKVVAIPTETVYGLAAIYDKEKAIAEIFRLKNRPPQNPLIMHVSDRDQVKSFASIIPEGFDLLASHFWPGPLTVVLPVDENKVPNNVRAGLPTQAFRMPAHPMALELIRLTGPLVAPSANLSGRPSAVSEAHVESDFGIDFPVLAGGMAKRGIESTILVLQNGRFCLGRLGALPPEVFTPLLGYTPELALAGSKVVCPGQLLRHYAPLATLILAKEFTEAKYIIGFSNRHYPEGAQVLDWGPEDRPEIILSNLYTILRMLDAKGIKDAHVDMNFPEVGLFQTLSERLRKAAS